MPSLSDLQRALVAHAYGEPNALILWLTSVPGNERGLAVHAANCRENLHDALAAVYPVILALVGEPCFQALARRYRTLHPSRCADIHAFGGELAAHLAATPAVAALAYLPDVASLEWTWHESYHAPDEPPLDLTALAALPTDAYDRLRFRLARHVRLLACRYPALAIWQAHQTGAIASSAIAVQEGAYHYIILRDGGIPGIRTIAAAEHALLSALASDTSLGHALASSGAPPEALGRWVEAGAVCGFRGGL